MGKRRKGESTTCLGQKEDIQTLIGSGVQLLWIEVKGGGVVQKSKRLPIYFYLGHETSVLAHKRQTVRKVSFDTRDFPSRPLCPLPTRCPRSLRHSLFHVLPSSCPVEVFFFISYSLPLVVLWVIDSKHTSHFR